MADISLRHLIKQYADGFTAVNDISLDIADGELMILVGPSGCGKSTLLRMIVGLEDITSGELLIAGRRVNEVAPRDRNLAMVFQNYALYPHLTAYENIAFPLRLRKALRAEQIDAKVRAVADTLQLTEYLQQRPAQLSGGQRQRVAMGRALVREAAAFLFDEPLSNLDAKLRGQMRTEILRLQRQLEMTTVYVTHDQTEAMTLGDRVALLRRGQLQQVGTPRELYERPRNLFVAGFIGSPPMSFVPATISGGRLELSFVSCPLSPRLQAAVGDRELVTVGIRPESFEDASAPRRQVSSGETANGVSFRAFVDVVEWLGNEIYAYVPLQTVHSTAEARLVALERDLDSDRLRNQLVVALNPASRIRAGEPAELWLDTSKLHLFDSESGERLSE